MFPKSGAPMETEAHSRALLIISFGVPSKGALPPGPPHGVSSERDALFIEGGGIYVEGFEGRGAEDDLWS